ncbi:neuronal acetylcholine receptor subunit alpha-9-like [Pecten maximus]|uniref:neuronal acetylcholine receptor subunit alpha-9-like n=1 Tax=Pecten maximus TaxID=6579 RepID=UPI001458BACF|nr:neuronal acetylcholine receptor subunit alpha-9-like [Pecten maximus]XP_033750130.1 neuronal acetylcholine receptor subunit alpha-9-like [Pecten maximus]
MLLYVTLALIGVFLLCVPLKVTSEYQICINKSTPVMTDEQRLYTVLMKDYDRNTRPVFNASHPVNVSVGITLTQIFDVDEKNQVITTNIWLDQEWKDEKLTWDPSQYNGLSVLRVPCKSLWLPDIVLYNSAEDYTQGFMEALAMVSHNGNVFWPPIVKLRSTCAIDITYFPFDDQICRMKVGSWAYDGFQVDVFNRSNSIDLSNFVSNGEWELIGVKAVRNVVKYQCCPESFPDVTFTLHISRRTLYYTYNVIIPCVMLSILTLLGFWMRPDSGEKVTLGLTVLLAFSVFMLLIAENMPATSSFVPLIGIYLTTVMALTSMSVILAVVTSNINQRGFKETDLPSFFRGFVIFLSKSMCMKLAHINNDNLDEVKLEQIRNGMRDNYTRHMKTTFSNDSGCNLIEYENGEPRASGNANARINQGDRNWELQEILNRLQILIQKEEEKEKSDALAKRWMEASEVIDRFLFWVFVLGTVISSVFLLMIYPTIKKVSLDS